jgi:hypothetical protein
MGSTWTGNGKRRQVGPHVGLCGLWTCTPGRIGVVSHRPEHLCALLRAHRRGWLRFSDRSWFLHEKTLPLPHPERIGSPLPLTIRGFYLYLATLKPDLILAGRSRPR